MGKKDKLQAGIMGGLDSLISSTVETPQQTTTPVANPKVEPATKVRKDTKEQEPTKLIQAHIPESLHRELMALKYGSDYNLKFREMLIIALKEYIERRKNEK